jgi:hypothetical protein
MEMWGGDANYRSSVRERAKKRCQMSSGKTTHSKKRIKYLVEGDAYDARKRFKVI